MSRHASLIGRLLTRTAVLPAAQYLGRWLGWQFAGCMSPCGLYSEVCHRQAKYARQGEGAGGTQGSRRVQGVQAVVTSWDRTGLREAWGLDCKRREVGGDAQLL